MSCVGCDDSDKIKKVYALRRKIIQYDQGLKNPHSTPYEQQFFREEIDKMLTQFNKLMKGGRRRRKTGRAIYRPRRLLT